MNSRTEDMDSGGTETRDRGIAFCFGSTCPKPCIFSPYLTAMLHRSIWRHFEFSRHAMIYLYLKQQWFLPYTFHFCFGELHFQIMTSQEATLTQILPECSLSLASLVHRTDWVPSVPARRRSSSKIQIRSWSFTTVSKGGDYSLQIKIS